MDDSLRQIVVTISGPVWSGLVRFGPVWSGLVRFGPVWSGLRQLLPICSLVLSPGPS